MGLTNVAYRWWDRWGAPSVQRVATWVGWESHWNTLLQQLEDLDRVLSPRMVSNPPSTRPVPRSTVTRLTFPDMSRSGTALPCRPEVDEDQPLGPQACLRRMDALSNYILAIKHPRRPRRPAKRARRASRSADQASSTTERYPFAPARVGTHSQWCATVPLYGLGQTHWQPTEIDADRHDAGGSSLPLPVTRPRGVPHPAPAWSPPRESDYEWRNGTWVGVPKTNPSCSRSRVQPLPSLLSMWEDNDYLDTKIESPEPWWWRQSAPTCAECDYDLDEHDAPHWSWILPHDLDIE